MRKLIFIPICLLAGVVYARQLTIDKVTVTNVPAATPTRVDTTFVTNKLTRAMFVVVNNGTNDAFYGHDSSVTNSNGLLLKANGGTRSVDTHEDLQPLWIYSPAGTTIAVEERF
jgi:hypothetical protein